MAKVICAGHICLDITPVFREGRSVGDIREILVPGRLIRMDGANVSTGGSVANTGLAMKLLGCDTALLGKVGNDAFGGIVRDILEKRGAGGLIVDGKSATSYTVVLAVPGIDRIFLHDPGANDTFSADDIPDAALEDACLFHFGYPTLMRRMYLDGGTELKKLFGRIGDRGIATSLDLAAVDPESEAGQAPWRDILRAVLIYVDFFMPSFEELLFMLDRPRYDEMTSRGGDITALRETPGEADRLARECLEMGCGAAVIKCGLSGIVYRTGSADRMRAVGKRLGLDAYRWADRAGAQPCYKADKVLSATGAGDVSIAAYLAAVLSGGGPEECASLAAAEGAMSVTAYDALSGILPLDRLRECLHTGWPLLNER